MSTPIPYGTAVHKLRDPGCRGRTASMRMTNASGRHYYRVLWQGSDKFSWVSERALAVVVARQRYRPRRDLAACHEFWVQLPPRVKDDVARVARAKGVSTRSLVWQLKSRLLLPSVLTGEAQKHTVPSEA